MNKLLSLGLMCVVICAQFLSYSQNIKTINFSKLELKKETVTSLGTPQIQAADYKVFQMDIEELKNQLNGITHREDASSGFIAQFELPHPDGTRHTYNAKENSTMHAELAAAFPEIRSYDASGVDNGAFVKWDITPHGFHAMIMQEGKSTIFIDPLIKGNSDYYIVYEKSDFLTDKSKDCLFDSAVEALENKTTPTSGIVKSFGTCELRTYRLALSATGEYTTFHGGTVALAQAAQVTTMNRVNGIYERDMAITMVIIPNNNLIVYTNPATDPFTNGNPGNMINENQTNTTAVIGSANYDIGHVFGTNSGGLAGLGVVCSNTQKARGVTGSGAPIGDPFDVDYVAHEIGHQFGANHTQNNGCNRNNATAMEPGSASTIMGYAGICAPNVQNNSDDHFHGVSLGEISVEILSAGHTCEVITPLANAAPVLVSTNGNVTVPANTPFALTAIATDADGDPLTYNWEQMNNNVSTQPPVATSTGGPNFRSNSSLTSPTRYFPNLVDLAAGGPFTWEVIPSVSRTMDFRVTIRDNSPGGGCNDHADVTVTTHAASGPFVVTYPTATGIVWAGATSETVTWDVANTNVAPVSCSNVDILLSTDGGLTYPTVLATNVPNNGSSLITVPNVATTTARVMVISENGTFFDISNNNFEITMATFDYTLDVTNPVVSICQPNPATFDVEIGEIGGYSDNVTLSVTGVPAGATSNFTVNPVSPIGTSQLVISNTGATAPGSYVLTITANSTSGTKQIDVTLNISAGSPGAISQISPANGAADVDTPVDFTWTASPEIGVTYEIDIATDAGFSSIVDQATGLVTPDYTSGVLISSTTYFWRVRAVTGCGQSAWSATFSFTTSTCVTTISSDVGQAINNATPVITSTITIAETGTINDVNIPLLDISHVWVGDLSATLTSPTGTIVQLFDGPGIPASQFGCDGDNIIASFDDDAILTAANFENMCNGTPPAISGAFQSMDPLANFIGESVTGTWTLTVTDGYPTADNGVLNDWSLELCVDAVCTDPDTPTLSGTTTICEGNNTTLSVSAGNLNDATNWQWYTGSCGGTPAGSGASILVNPVTTTTYFVRGEGGCVTPGACATITVTVQSVDNTVTNNGTSLMSNQGGASYQWLDCDNGNAPIGGATGQTFVPAVTGNYAVEVTLGGCTETSGCELISITGCGNPAIPTLSGITSICEGDNTTLSVSAGNLNDATNWQWYTGSCGGTPAGSGASLLVNPVTTTTYFVRGEGGCVTPGACATITVTVQTVDNTVTNNGTSLMANQGGATYQWVDCDNGNAPIGGATGQTFVPAVTGNYAVEVTLGGCTETSGCELITVCVNPTVPTLSGTTTICAGSNTTLSVSAGNLNDATNWQWYTGSCGGTPVGSGASILVSPVTTTTYFVRGEGGCVTPGACATITVTVQTVDNTVTNNGTSLMANQGGASYQWLDCDNGNAPIGGATGQTFVPAVTGNYAVEVTLGGCTETSGCEMINLCVNPDIPALAGTITICEGDNIILSVGASDLNDATGWEWYTGSCGGTAVGNGASLMVSPAATTTYFVRGEGGCVIPGVCASITLAVQTVDASVTNSGTTLMANQMGATYQWVDCDNGDSPIFAETGQTFEPAVTGNYAVEVTMNGCTETSTCQLVDYSGLNHLGAGNLAVFPNPTEGYVHVEWTESITKIQVMDARGRILNVVDNPMGNKYTMNFTDYSSGVYFIRIENNSGTSVFDVVKQ